MCGGWPPYIDKYSVRKTVRESQSNTRRQGHGKESSPPSQSFTFWRVSPYFYGQKGWDISTYEAAYTPCGMDLQCSHQGVSASLVLEETQVHHKNVGVPCWKEKD